MAKNRTDFVYVQSRFLVCVYTTKMRAFSMFLSVYLICLQRYIDVSNIGLFRFLFILN